MTAVSENVSLVLPDALLDAIAEKVLERLGDLAPATPYMTVDEAAAYLCSERQRVYDLLSSSRLTRFKDGSRVLISRAELVAYLLPPDAQPRARRGVAA